ncbi:MAG: sigma 54-interacting transcriptional regulator, partial [Proteobacteria bacterium]|nr:sigma 54-interacting transcriptional regulator [Pseudomonadota bacterium]
TSFNQSARALMGLEDAEVIGRECRDVFEEVPCHLRCPFKDREAPGTTDMVVEIVDAHQTRHLVTRLASPLYDKCRRLVGCLTVLQDHTALANLINRVTHEERSLKIILDNLDVAIFTVNRGGHLTFFNTTAERITGYNRRQVLGRPVSDLIRGPDPDALDPLRQAMTDGQTRMRGDLWVCTRDGECVPVRAEFMPLQNERGRIVGGLGTLHDLTLVQQLDQVISDQYTMHNMIGKDPSMQKIFEMVGVVAASDATVLIEGATGTGKDLLAKVIHSASHRVDKPLVKVNCAALPDSLLESEMFGYLKGAFTGADRDKPGRFQDADGGTIYLDEIGDLPLPLQAKLLRVLEDREFYPLGSRHTVKVDVRIISATNRNLEDLMAKGQFREDLFYRLNVIHIQIPRLKDRRADLPLLIRHIMRRLCAAGQKPMPEISKTAMKILLSYEFPGNVRELENILEHALIICQDDKIEPEHLHDYVQSRISASRRPAPPEVRAREIPADPREREMILKALDRHHWHRSRTARALKMDRSTLWRKMKKFGMLV